MVQFIKGSADPRDAATGALAYALGGGLTKGVTSHFANKALDEVLNNEEYAEKPQSEKIGLIQKALQPYGKPGEELFQKRMQIEQLADQEKQQKLQQKQVLEKEQRLFQQQKELQNLKNLGKSPLGGASFQPTPEPIAKKMAEIEEQNPDATPTELENKYAEAEIPQGYYGKKIETARRNDEATRKEQIQFHDESKKYADEIREGAARAEKQKETVADLLKNVDKIKPLSIANVFAKMGTIGEKISNGFKSAEQGKFEAALPQLIEGWKEVFGIRLSDADLKIIQDKLPSIGKSPEANKAIMNIINKYADFSLLKQKAAKNVLDKKGVKTKHGVLRPLGYENDVEDEFSRLKGNFSKGLFDEMPDPTEYKNRILEDDSGKKYKSNGTEWVPQ